MYKEMGPGEFNAAVGMDGHKWAEAFHEMVVEGNKNLSLDNLLGWFCNAIMAGYDAGQKKILDNIREGTEGVVSELHPYVSESMGPRETCLMLAAGLVSEGVDPSKVLTAAEGFADFLDGSQVTVSNHIHINVAGTDSPQQ